MLKFDGVNLYDQPIDLIGKLVAPAFNFIAVAKNSRKPSANPAQGYGLQSPPL
jgi:hypothetical protein